MKKIFYSGAIVMTILIVVLFININKDDSGNQDDDSANQTTESANDETTENDSVISRTQTNKNIQSYSSDGHFFVSSEGLLFYLTENCDAATLCCTKVECTHMNLDECTAQLGNEISCGSELKVIDEKIYYLAYDYDEERQENVLSAYRMNLDGTGVKKLKTLAIEAYTDETVLVPLYYAVGNYIYYEIGGKPGKAGSVYVVDTECKTEPIEIIGEDDDISEIGYIGENDGSVYFNMLKSSDESTISTQVVSYNPETGEKKVVVDVAQGGRFFMSGDNIYFRNVRNDVYLCQKDGSQELVIDGSLYMEGYGFIGVYTNENYICMWVSDEYKEIMVFQNDGTYVRTITFPDEIDWGSPDFYLIDDTLILFNGVMDSGMQIYGWDINASDDTVSLLYDSQE
jgi:hypothetical protein